MGILLAVALFMLLGVAGLFHDRAPGRSGWGGRSRPTWLMALVCGLVSSHCSTWAIVNMCRSTKGSTLPLMFSRRQRW